MRTWQAGGAAALAVLDLARRFAAMGLAPVPVSP